MNKTTMWVMVVAAFIIGGVAGFLIERQRATDKMEAYKLESQKMTEKDSMTDDKMMAASPSPAQDAMMMEPVMMGANNIVTDSKDMTLYTYDKDTKDTSNCYGTCATNWPPYLVANGSAPEKMPAHLGTTKRTDGSTQYTWDGKPLYYYISDKKVGDVTGDGVGGVWHVAK